MANPPNIVPRLCQPSHRTILADFPNLVPVPSDKGLKCLSLSQPDAAATCGAHGGWLVDMDEGHGGEKNRLVRELISDAVGQGDWGIPGYKYGPREK